jgi:hypothetical protein
MIEDEPKKCPKRGGDLEEGVMQFVHNAMWFGDDYEETVFSQLWPESIREFTVWRCQKCQLAVLLYGENKGVEL